MVQLLCTVRDCGLPLAREPRRYICARGHSFDIARSGYVNLLQPQERRAKVPGDSPEAVAARRRFLDRGFAEPLLLAIGDFVEKVGLTPEDAILDVGCGEGYYLGGVAKRFGVEGHGVDISTAAIDLAARRYKECHFIVANADRALPYADDSFKLVLSITGRLHAAELARVGAWAMIAVSAPDDLHELRGGRQRDRVQRTIETFGPHFELVDQSRASTIATLDAAAASDILAATYRPRAAPAGEVTLALDLLLFRRRTTAASRP